MDVRRLSTGGLKLFKGKKQKRYYFYQKVKKQTIFGRPEGAKSPLAPSGRLWYRKVVQTMQKG
jgi:hypothetical protein